jgi:tetratricopeptide (TPR) repeat protein
MAKSLDLMLEQFKKFQNTLLETNQKLLDVGRQKADDRKYNEALASFDAALKLNEQINNREGVIAALYGKATTLIDKGSLRKALIVYNKLAEMGSEGRLYFDLGYVYGELGDYEQSLKCYEHYLKLYPGDYVALANIGWTYERMESYKEAEKYYQKSLKFKPDYLSALNSLVILLDRLGKDDKARRNQAKKVADRALNIYDREIRKDPKNPDLLVNKAIALDVRGDREKALDFYNQALIIEPNNAFALYNKSCTTALLGKKEESLELLEKAIQWDPVYADLAKNDTDFGDLRTDKKFKKLLVRAPRSELIKKQ